MRVTPTLLSVVCQVLFYPEGLWASWDDWWAYEGISGPDFWGLLNPEWSLCSKGRRQSPVDIKPPNLLYDPHLRPLQVGKNRVSGTLMNSGHSVVFRSDFTEPDTRINISGGPLSYSFSFEEIHLRFGLSDKEGSEHTIAGHGYPAELQILGYNTDLFSNMSEALALQRSEGIVGIAVMLQVGNLSNSELRLLSAPLHNLIYQGQSAYLESLSVRELLPDTDFFMTYEGSLTMPGCYETVTWIVMNKPIYITKQQLYVLRKLQKGNEENPKAPLANNFRPTQPLNQRIVRTNIDFKRLNGRSCPTMYRDMQYSSNTWNRGP